ncbi:MAG: hypothetical protein ACRD15_21325, partial [Vicinamibacterales bacterium]
MLREPIARREGESGTPELAIRAGVAQSAQVDLLLSGEPGRIHDAIHGGPIFAASTAVLSRAAVA